MRAARRRQGLVLIGVILMLALGITVVTTFLRRATVDGLVVRHRDLAARAEALARGGVELGTALVLQDRLDEAARDFRVETRRDRWARVARTPIRVPDGGELRLRIEDAGARLNLNALLAEGRPRSDLAEVFLSEWLARVIEEMPVPEDGRRPPPRDPLELARNLLDWIDDDDLRADGGPEAGPYAERGADRDRRQGPPDRPLLSVDELRRVEGFDAALVEALRPYVAVHPLFRADGVNPNTAPPWVLAALYHGTPGDYRLADADTVRAVLDIREGGGILCAETADHPACTPILEVVPGEIFPPPAFRSEVFRITAEGRYGEVRRTVEAVLDRRDPTDPQLRAWRVE